RQAAQLRPRARSDEPGQHRRVPQGVAGRRSAEGSGDTGTGQSAGHFGPALTSDDPGGMSAITVEHGRPPPPAKPDKDASRPMPGGIVASAGLHIGLFVLILLGLPSLLRPPPP